MKTKKIKLEEGVSINVSNDTLSYKIAPEGEIPVSKGYFAHSSLIGTGICVYAPQGARNGNVDSTIQRIVIACICLTISLITFVVSFTIVENGMIIRIFGIVGMLASLIGCILNYDRNEKSDDDDDNRFTRTITIINGYLNSLNDENDRLHPTKDSLFTTFVKNILTTIDAKQVDLKQEILLKYVNRVEAAQEVDLCDKILVALKLEKKHNLIPIYECKLQSALTKFTGEKYNIIEKLSDGQLDAYKTLLKSFELLMQAQKIWNVDNSMSNSVNRKEVRFYVGCFAYIYAETLVPVVNVQSEYLYLYPQFIIKTKGGIEFDIIRWSETTVKFAKQRFIEHGNYPTETEKVDTTYMHTTKDGKRDLRYSYNPEYPVVLYGYLHFKDINSSFLVSNMRNACSFACSVSKYVNDYFSVAKTSQTTIANPVISQTTSQPHFFDLFKVNMIIPIANKIVSFATELIENNDFINKFDKICPISGDFIPKSEKNGIKMLYAVLMDIVYCHTKLYGDIDLNSKESIGLVYMCGVLLYDRDTFWIKNTPKEKCIADTSKVLQLLIAYYRDNCKYDGLLLPLCLHQIGEDINFRYIVSIYRYVSTIAKVDNAITKKEQDFINSIWNQQNVIEKNINNDKCNKIMPMSVAESNPIVNLKSDGDCFSELDSLIGLDSVKKEIRSLSNFIKISRQREQKGLKSTRLSYHCVFTGNPGTGKTTVARIVARIYKQLGILKKGHLVETDRSGLVAEYVGQTAVKTNQIIDSALDGILFIDEAYTLASGTQNDYGNEAIGTLLKRMEDNRDRLVVIVAGYSDEMKSFVDANPGLQSRFTRYINFPDYSANELLRIFESLLQQYDYVISDDTKTVVLDHFTLIIQNNSSNFGNGRYVRNFFEKTLQNQADRLSLKEQLSQEMLQTIEKEDLAL